MVLDENTDKYFAYKIAAIVSFGLALSTVGATYVDARIPSHVRWGARTYPYGYWVALVSVPLFISTVIALRRATSRTGKCFSASLPLIIAVASIQWAFKPEVPHQGIVSNTAIYAIIVVIATWLHTSQPNTDFLEDHSLSEQVRIE